LRNRGRAAGTLAVELLQGSVKCSPDTGFVAGEILERVLAVTLLAEGEREVIGRVGVVDFVFLEVGLDVGGLLLEDEPFNDAAAPKSPGGDDDLLDQDGLEGIDGREMVAER